MSLSVAGDYAVGQFVTVKAPINRLVARAPVLMELQPLACGSAWSSPRGSNGKLGFTLLLPKYNLISL